MFPFGKKEKTIDQKINEVFERDEALKELKKEKAKLEKDVETLNGTIERLKRDAREAEHKRKLEDEETRHLIKLREEKLELDFDRKNMEREKAKVDAIAKVREEYRDKIEKGLEARGKELREMYGEILARLPNVNVMLDNQAPTPAARTAKKK